MFYLSVIVFSRCMWIVCFFGVGGCVYFLVVAFVFRATTTVWWCCRRDADGVLNFASRRVFPVGDRFFLVVCGSYVFRRRWSCIILRRRVRLSGDDYRVVVVSS